MLTLGAFGSVLMVAGLYYFIFEPIFPETIEDSQWFAYAVLLVVSLFSFGFIDKIFFRKFRKRPVASRRYFRFSEAIRTISLTRFLHRESLTILSNNKRWRIHLLNLSYFFIAIVISLNDMTLDNDVIFEMDLLDHRDFREFPAYRYVLDNDEYDDLLSEGHFVKEASIPSEFITTNSLPVFITYDKVFDLPLDYLADSLGFKNDYYEMSSMDDWDRNSRGIQFALSEIFQLRINNKQQDSIKWFYRNHPVTNQEGFYTRLDISDLPSGEQHGLVVRYVPIHRGRSDTASLRWIPFWKE